MDADLKTTSHDYVVLLHGLSKDPEIMRKLEAFLSPLGYEVRNIGYPSLQYTIEKLTEIVWASVQKACPDPQKKIHFVGHSLGGIIIRAILARYSVPNLGRVVMIAVPNHGTEVVDFLVKLKYYRRKFGPAGQELITGPKGFVAKLPQKVDYDLGIIAGNKTVDYLFSWFILKSKGDGKVSIENTKLDGMRDHIVLAAPHPTITNFPATAHQVAYFLKYDKFDH